LTCAGAALRAEGLKLAFRERRTGEVHAVLDDASVLAPAGAMVGITGPSGSGKTSLLHVLSGIARPDAGRVVWDAIEIWALGEGARDRWRRENVGLVFQDFHLLPGMSVLENVLVSATFDRFRVPAALRARARDLLERVGAPIGNRPVETLSRGEQQRVAIARALLRQPRILLADEPTASLDAANGARTIDLLAETARDLGATLFAVTHDPHLLARLEPVYHLDAGRLAVAAPIRGDVAGRRA
jgi:putative ABC transport system ATP-binding protein